jgi:hypothetical protein
VLRRLYADSIVSGVAADTVRNPVTMQDTIIARNVFRDSPRYNIFLEFFLRVPRAQFLDRLRIRGGVLLPVGRAADKLRPETRITLSVPIVDLDRF